MEAGVANAGDADRLMALPDYNRIFRILIEVSAQNHDEADATVTAVFERLSHSKVQHQILLHGQDATMWHFLRIARERRWSTRIGLEDGKHMPDGQSATGNTALVAKAAVLYQTAR